MSTGLIAVITLCGLLAWFVYLLTFLSWRDRVPGGTMRQFSTTDPVKRNPKDYRVDWSGGGY